MLRYLIILLLPLTLFSQTEEKRLALVIGNSNYDKGPLNNPVNDALLMARTLDSLDFDVILDTNIANKENFIRTIREFGNKRSDYDVAFVYYAGHGIQVGAENFLLPTKVNFETEYDVVDFGVSVQNIMRYLTGMTNQVNILVLDACRDNPFEGNWNKTRSLKGGGLAKIPPPTGSLIAFSTDAGNTAADGDGENSIYCQSLCENMMLENTSLDQVFRNVRSDVLKQTDGNQRPVEASQLTGNAFYLVKSDYENLFNQVYKLIGETKNDISQDFILLREISLKNCLQAIGVCSEILAYEKNNKRALKLKGDIYLYLNEIQNAIECYDQAIKIDSLFLDSYMGLAYCYENLYDYENALTNYQKAIFIDSTNYNVFNRRGIVYGYYLDDTEKGLKDVNKSIQLNPNFYKPYNNRGVYYNELGEYSKAILDFNKSLKLAAENNINTDRSKCLNYMHMADSYSGLEDYENAIKFNLLALKHDPPEQDINPIFFHLSELYYNLNEYKLGILYNDSIMATQEYAPCYGRKAQFLLEYFIYDKTEFLKQYQINDIEIAFEIAFRKMPENTRLLSSSIRLDYITKNWESVIEKNKKIITILNDDNKAFNEYESMGDAYFNLLEYESSIKSYSKALTIYEDLKNQNIDPDLTYVFEVNQSDKISRILSSRAEVYRTIGEFQNSKNDLDSLISLEPGNHKNYSSRGLFYYETNRFKEAILDFEKSLEIKPTAEAHNYLANTYYKLDNLKKAERYYSLAVDKDTISIDQLIDRSAFYISTAKYELAKYDLEQAMQIDQNDPTVYFYLHKLYVEKGKYLRALRYIDQAINNFNKDLYIIPIFLTYNYYSLIDLYLSRVFIYNKLGDSKEMVCEDYKNICELGDCEMFDKNCK